MLASLQRQFGAGDGTLPQQQLGSAETAILQKYLRYQEQKKALSVQAKEIDQTMKRLQGQIVASMGACWTAGCRDAETQYLVSSPAHDWQGRFGAVASGSPGNLRRVCYGFGIQKVQREAGSSTEHAAYSSIK